MRHRLKAGILLAWAWVGTAQAQAPEGTEFRVNAATASDQTTPVVAADASGNFVVVWVDTGHDGDSYGIRGRRYPTGGLANSGLGDLNSYTTFGQDAPSVAADANGNFVVVWESYSQDGDSMGVFGQRFDFSGAPRGSEFRVNSSTVSFQGDPAVASDASGNFVVVWSSPMDGSFSAVIGQRFDSSGVAQGGEFLVNTFTTGNQDLPVVASEAAGNFVVVWTSNAQDLSSSQILGQRFDATGVRLGPEFQVNSYTTGKQQRPSVAASASGDFVVAWESFGQDGGRYGVFGQRFNASGVPQGTEFRANTSTVDDQMAPTVGMDKKGGFVVAWRGYTSSDFHIFGQRYDAAGAPRGVEFQVNTGTTDTQSAPAITVAPDGDFVVVWQGHDGDGYGVFGQRFGDILFQDGFESGDLTRWSSAVTDGTDLRAAGAAAQAGTAHGMAATVNDTNPIYVQDDTPSAEGRYRARFYFDPHGFDPGEAAGSHRIRLLIAFADAGTRSISIVLKRTAGAYSVEGRVRLDDGSRADTGFFDITDAPHFFEFDWRQASTLGATDGTFTLRVDDTVVSTLTGLQDGSSTVGYVRLGAMTVKTGATGTLRFDQFESRRRTRIGPE